MRDRSPDAFCWNCPYFFCKKDEQWGDCRHHPREFSGDGFEWPQAKADEWCGDHPDNPQPLIKALELIADAITAVITRK